MRKLRNLIGMPVVLGGRKIGRLVQAELSSDMSELSGIWVDCGLRGTRRIPAENLEMIGRKAVSVDSRGERRRCKTGFAIRRAVSTDGRRIGAITGAEIDELTFRVQALELSMGLWDDLCSGRRRVDRSAADVRAEVILRDSAEEPSKEDET